MKQQNIDDLWKKELERLWNKRHVQELIAATKKDHGDPDNLDDEDYGPTYVGTYSDGTVIWRYAVDDLQKSWKKRKWSIKLFNQQRFVGTFERLDPLQKWDMDAIKDYSGYRDYLEHNENLAPFTISVKLDTRASIFGAHIEQANIEVTDSYGWPAYLFIYENTLEITAHIASFSEV